MAATAPRPSPAPATPLRQIGLYAATSVTVGCIVGSGIFRSPHSVALELTSLAPVLAAWVLGGLLSLCGSFVLAEMAALHPRSGGLYVYIKEAFGELWAFVFGWANLWVVKPTVIASITSVFALYFCQAVWLPKAAELPVGVLAIALLTFVNWLGVRQGSGTQTLFTTAKVVGILGLVVAAFLLPHGGPAPGAPAAELPAAKPFLAAFVAAMIPVLFAYDGWTDSTYVAGEIKDPARTLPFAIVIGTAIVIALYVVTNLAYYAVLSPADLATYEAVGSETIRRIFGAPGVTALAALVAISTFGTTNGSILTGPRVTQAMAADGLLWRPAARLHPRRGSPEVALWIQGTLAIAWLAFANGFEDLSGWFVTTSWTFYGLVTAALFVYRRREKVSGSRLARERAEAEAAHGGRLYRTPLFPLTPLLFVVVTAFLIVSDLTQTGWRAWAGVGMAALGVPVYFIWKGRGRVRA
jgi:amino acid transporter